MRKSWKIESLANPIESLANPIEGSTCFTVFETCFQSTNCIVNRIPTSCGRNNKQKSKFYFDAICCLGAPEKHTIKAKTSLKKEFQKLKLKLFQVNYLNCLFHSSWAFAKADLKVFLKQVQDKALLASAVAIRFRVCAAHLLCLGSARFTMLSLSVTSLSNNYVQKH